MDPRRFKSIFFVVIVSIALFLAGFIISSGIGAELLNNTVSGLNAKVGSHFVSHYARIWESGRHYFLLPEKDYAEYGINGFSIRMIVPVFLNAIFHILFQPVFLCVFSPQVVLNIVMLPFALYGAVKYFTRVPLIIAAFIIISFYAGIHGVVVEALIRHGMICELIYILIGSAGFTGLITKSLSS